MSSDNYEYGTPLCQQRNHVLNNGRLLSKGSTIDMVNSIPSTINSIQYTSKTTMLDLKWVMHADTLLLEELDI